MYLIINFVQLREEFINSEEVDVASDQTDEPASLKSSVSVHTVFLLLYLSLFSTNFFLNLFLGCKHL